MELLDADTKTNSMSEIQSFFSGTSVFLTGATGFLGHVLLSKLIRCCPDIKCIYVLLREKKGKTAIERFKEMMEDEVFEKLKAECPETVLKIRPIIGDCLKPKLGLSTTDSQLLKEEVNVIFHVAATVRFDAPLKQAVNMNIRSTSDLLDLAQEMKQLKKLLTRKKKTKALAQTKIMDIFAKSFVHVSTAFSNCAGRKVIEERLYDSPISAENLMMLVENLDDEIIDRITPGLLGNYPNTYVFTKAIAEDVCRKKGLNLPLAIFRPAIVISCVKEPLPGWINNVYGPTGLVAAAAVGLLRAIYSDENCKANVVPCDFVVNAAIASAWSVGTKSKSEQITLTNGHTPESIVTTEKATIKITEKNPDVNSNGYIVNEVHSVITDAVKNNLESANKISVFNYSCDLLEKPFTWKEFMKLNEIQEPKMPSSLSIWTYSLALFKYKPIYKIYCFLIQLFPALIFDSVARLIGKEPKLMDAYQRIDKLTEVLSYFSTREWDMQHDKVVHLWYRLSEKDKELFDFNLRNIDWMNYYYIHCFGIRKYILKEPPETIPAAQKRRRILLAVHYFLLFTLAFMSFYFLFSLMRRIVS